MDPRLKTIAENLDAWKIGLDDSFQFHCTECGQCCINREDILLSPRDLFNASKALNMRPKAFVKEYCDTYIGEDSRVPIVRMKPRGSIKRCPMLKDRRCSIHKSKPAVCALFPLGRTVSFAKGSYNAGSILNSQIQYIINPITCGDKSETHTVRSWLTDFGIDVQDAYFLKWHSLISEVCLFIRKVEGKISEKLLNTIWTTIYICLYLNYDPGEEFMPQFEKNAEEILNAVRNTVKKLGDVS